MYSIIRCQSGQYKVKPGDKIIVNKLDLEVGENYSSNQVLLVESDDGKVSVGQPYIKGAKYTAKIERQFKDKKITVFKKKRRHNYRRKKGHRQQLTELTIVNINY